MSYRINLIIKQALAKFTNSEKTILEDYVILLFANTFFQQKEYLVVHYKIYCYLYFMKRVYSIANTWKCFY